MEASPAADSRQPDGPGAAVHVLGRRYLIGQAGASFFSEAAEPFIGCFSADRPLPAKRCERFLSAVLVECEAVSLFFCAGGFPRHIASDV